MDINTYYRSNIQNFQSYININQFLSLLLRITCFSNEHVKSQTTLSVCWRRSMQYPVRISSWRIIQNSLFFLSSVLFLILFICLLLCQKRFVVIKYCEKKNCTKFVLLAIQAIIFWMHAHECLTQYVQGIYFLRRQCTLFFYFFYSSKLPKRGKSWSAF